MFQRCFYGGEKSCFNDEKKDVATVSRGREILDVSTVFLRWGKCIFDGQKKDDSTEFLR